jgi:tetratricopeptide (TPR) repeat protein
MATSKVYRSLMIAGISAAALFTGACSEAGKKHQALKEEMRDRWTATTMGVKLQLAQQQYAVGDYDKCRKTLDEAMAAGHPHPGIKILSAKVDIEKGALDTAAESLKEAMALAPTDPEPFYLTGVVYQRWQKMDAAMGYYQQAWDKKPADARLMLAVVEMQITLGRLDEAQALLEGKLDQFEQTAAVRIALARIAALKGDHLASSKHYRDAFLLLPDDQGVKQAYAESLFFAGKFAEAAPMLEDIRTQLRPAEGPPTDTQLSARLTVTEMLGQAYLNLRRPMDARACFQEVLRYQPENTRAVLGIGKVCVETNDLAAALSAGRKVLRSEPKNVQAMILIAVVQQKQKKWEDALATLKSAAAAAPKDSTILCMAGVSELKLGHSSEAVGYFEKAVAANPRDAWATELLVQHKAVPEGVAGSNADQAGEMGVITNAQPTGKPMDDR